MALIFAACFDAPPAYMSSAPTSWNGDPGLEDEVIDYQCPTGTATALGQYNTSLVCRGGNWIPEDTQYDMTGLLEVFLCEPGKWKPIHLIIWY